MWEQVCVHFIYPCGFMASSGHRADFLLLSDVDGGPDPNRTLGRTMGLSLAGPFPC